MWKRRVEDREIRCTTACFCCILQREERPLQGQTAMAKLRMKAHSPVPVAFIHTQKPQLLVPHSCCRGITEQKSTSGVLTAQVCLGMGGSHWSHSHSHGPALAHQSHRGSKAQILTCPCVLKSWDDGIHHQCFFWKSHAVFSPLFFTTETIQAIPKPGRLSHPCFLWQQYNCPWRTHLPTLQWVWQRQWLYFCIFIAHWKGGIRKIRWLEEKRRHTLRPVYWYESLCCWSKRSYLTINFDQRELSCCEKEKQCQLTWNVSVRRVA